MASIRMIMACGAESRIAKKYAAFVEEAKRHAQFMSPLIALQFGLIVRFERGPDDPFESPLANMVSSSSACTLALVWPFGTG